MRKGVIELDNGTKHLISTHYVACIYCETVMHEKHIILKDDTEVCPICGSVDTFKDILFLEKTF